MAKPIAYSLIGIFLGQLLFFFAVIDLEDHGWIRIFNVSTIQNQ